MAIHRTAMGKAVDMQALQSRNERTRAVGNMPVNARGDTIDSHGRVIQPATAKVNNAYARTVGNRSAHAVKRPAEKIQPDTPKIDLNELTEAERELEESLEDDLEVEQIKQEEIKEQAKKAKK
jgi:hypothetical protein